MTAPFVPKAKHNSYSYPDSTEIVTASDGSQSKRFIGVPEFAQRYGITTNGVIYHCNRKKLFAIKSGYRWWIDMKLSVIPVFDRERADRVRGSIYPIRDQYLAEFIDSSIQFYGPKDLYDPLLDDLGLKKGPSFVFKPNKGRYQLIQLRLVLADGRKARCQCHPDRSAFINEMVGKAIRGSTIIRVNKPRKTLIV